MSGTLVVTQGAHTVGKTLAVHAGGLESDTWHTQKIARPMGSTDQSPGGKWILGVHGRDSSTR